MSFGSAQRNTYLTGFTLFLSLVLTRTFYIVLELISAQEEYAKLKQSVRPNKLLALGAVVYFVSRKDPLSPSKTKNRS